MAHKIVGFSGECCLNTYLPIVDNSGVISGAQGWLTITDLQNMDPCDVGQTPQTSYNYEYLDYAPTQDGENGPGSIHNWGCWTKQTLAGSNGNMGGVNCREESDGSLYDALTEGPCKCSNLGNNVGTCNVYGYGGKLPTGGWNTIPTNSDLTTSGTGTTVSTNATGTTVSTSTSGPTGTTVSTSTSGPTGPTGTAVSTSSNTNYFAGVDVENFENMNKDDDDWLSKIFSDIFNNNSDNSDMEKDNIRDIYFIILTLLGLYLIIQVIHKTSIFNKKKLFF